MTPMRRLSRRRASSKSSTGTRSTTSWSAVWAPGCTAPPNCTGDFDVCPDTGRKNLGRLAEALKELGAKMRGLRTTCNHPSMATSLPASNSAPGGPPLATCPLLLGCPPGGHVCWIIFLVVDESLAGLFADFEVARRSAKPSPHSERAARSDFTAIHTWLRESVGKDDLELPDVTPRGLRLAFARFAEIHAAASIARAWSTWNQFFGFLVTEDLVAGNPMGAVAHPKVGRRTPKPLQGEDAPEALLQTVAAGARPGRWPWPERDLAFIATALLTGLRLSELIGLNLGSIDGRPGERRIKVVGKGRKERTVPIEETLQEVIDTYMDTRRERFPGVKLGPKAPLFVDRRADRLKRGGAHYLVERSYRAAGLANRVPAGAMVHALRHTFATRLAEDGATATEIQALLGHESLNTSQGYIDATANATRQAARANRTYRTLRQLQPPAGQA